MKRSRGASVQAAGEEAEHGERHAVAGVHGVAHLGADQGLVAEVVVAAEVVVPQRPPAVTAHDGAISSGRTASSVVGGGKRGGSVSGPNVIGPDRFWRHFGGGSSMRSSLCMASMATGAIMSLIPPSALYQPMRRQNSFDRAWRLSAGGPAINERSSAISAVVKSRP